MLTERELRHAASRASMTVAKSNAAARSLAKHTAFLSHSHHDQILAKGLQKKLREEGWDVYIDWEDAEMPSSPNKITANNIKSRIKTADWFIFLATQRSVSSRWCPWEIGVGDIEKGSEKILIVPVVSDNGTWYGNEYLQLYKKIDDGSNSLTGKSGLVVYPPGADQGTFVGSYF